MMIRVIEIVLPPNGMLNTSCTVWGLMGVDLFFKNNVSAAHLPNMTCVTVQMPKWRTQECKIVVGH